MRIATRHVFGSESFRRARWAGGALMILAALSGAALAGPGDAPEIDPGSLTSALTLLCGSVLLLTSRRRKT